MFSICFTYQCLSGVLLLQGVAPDGHDGPVKHLNSKKGEKRDNIILNVPHCPPPHALPVGPSRQPRVERVEGALAREVGRPHLAAGKVAEVGEIHLKQFTIIIFLKYILNWIFSCSR